MSERVKHVRQAGLRALQAIYDYYERECPEMDQAAVVASLYYAIGFDQSSNVEAVINSLGLPQTIWIMLAGIADGEGCSVESVESTNEIDPKAN